MAESKIEWTDEVWNPTTGCSYASEGCRNCYAFTMTKRLAAMGQKKYQGLAGKGHFNGVLKTHDRELFKPLDWKKPRRVFVNSMSDLFHEKVPTEFIDRTFAVMAICKQHTFQVLTKRPERMAEYLSDRMRLETIYDHWHEFSGAPCEAQGWPLPNVWLGASVEDQAAADERIPHLLKCPAAVRFLSCEPLLGPVDVWRAVRAAEGRPDVDEAVDRNWNRSNPYHLHWAIIGGESGPGARPCNVNWIRDLVRQLRGTGAACFVKQLGKFAVEPYSDWKARTTTRLLNHRLSMDIEAQGIVAWHLDHSKGGDPNEWPDDLRVREFPETYPEVAP